jgi:hypothetical protein
MMCILIICRCVYTTIFDVKSIDVYTHPLTICIHIVLLVIHNSHDVYTHRPFTSVEGVRCGYICNNRVFNGLAKDSVIACKHLPFGPGNYFDPKPKVF